MFLFPNSIALTSRYLELIFISTKFKYTTKKSLGNWRYPAIYEYNSMCKGFHFSECAQRFSLILLSLNYSLRYELWHSTDHAVVFMRFFLRLLLLPLSHVHYSLKRFSCSHYLSVLFPSDNAGSSIRVILQNRITLFLLHLASLHRRHEETISKLNSDVISTERRLALTGPLFIASCQQRLISQSVIK